MHVRVAVADGPRPHRRRVRAGVRLGQAVGPELLTRQHLGQPAAWLLVGAGGEQAEARQRVHADARRRPTPTPRRSPRAPAGRPRTADRHRRTPPGRAATADPARPSVRNTSRGNSPDASICATLGASSLATMSRVSAIRSEDSSDGIRRVAGMGLLDRDRRRLQTTATAWTSERARAGLAFWHGQSEGRGEEGAQGASQRQRREPAAACGCGHRRGTRVRLAARRRCSSGRDTSSPASSSRCSSRSSRPTPGA